MGPVRSRVRPGRRVMIGAVGAAMMLVSACTSSSGSSSNSGVIHKQTSPRKAKNQLVAIAAQDPGTFDYTKSNLTAVRLWIPNIVEPLLYFVGGKAAPGLADKWTISADKKTYTFHIRDAKFSTGAPVTADDVVFSLKTMQKSPVTDIASAYASVTGIAKTSDSTVKVTLSQPSTAFFEGMGSLAGLIQPQADASKISTDPIGTGPYKLVKYVPNSSITLTANPYYWGTKPAIPNVTIDIIADEGALLNALRAGQADLFAPAGAQYWSQMAKDGIDKAYHMVTYPQSGEPTYGVINSRIPIAERQTIAKVFDRNAIKSLFDAPSAIKTACTFASTDRSYFEPYSAKNCPYPYDPKAAAEAVKANGYGNQALTFTSLTDVGDLKPPAEIMIAEMQAAGFKVNNNALSLARYSQLVFSSKHPDFDVTVMAGDDDPSQWMCTNKSQVNWATYCDPHYAQLINKANAATTPAAYDAYMKQAAETLTKDAVIVPLLSKAGIGLLDPALKGWKDPNVAVGIRLATLHW